jgi:hypothetical protein
MRCSWIIVLANGQSATGNYDLQFALADALTGGNYLGSTLTNASVSVAKGLFTVSLDFGSAVFGGSPRWLEIVVRTNGSAGAYRRVERFCSVPHWQNLTFATQFQMIQWISLL